jgi:hypothetical protein
MQTEVVNISKNVMGTLSIDMKIKGMRKSQKFVVYPITKDSKNLVIQSKTRIAKVDLNGKGLCSKSHQSGAYFVHLQIDKLTPFEFKPSDWRQIVEYIGLTEGDSVGGVVVTDNSGAKSIFGLD